ncbi:MAG TPA: hypothetical protein VLK30_12755 [Candidatus Limnocylindrales bacterium]|nr:hypothetical protein [Candidatus Limnocylindrales bacterium]
MNRKDTAIRRYIYETMDLKDVVDGVQRDHEWSGEDARYAERWYRNFLWLNYVRGGRGVFGISAKADELWHGHIVYTKRYRQACERIFGEYLDHVPLRGAATTADSARFRRAGVLYDKEFEERPIDFNVPCYTPYKPPKPPK